MIGTPDIAADSAADEVITLLYGEHRHDLLRLACFLVTDRGLAEELVQDAFAALHRKWGHVEPSAAPAYLRACIVNGARNTYRRRGVVRRHLRPIDPTDAPPADFAVLLAEEHREVVAALRDLPQRQREVLVLRYWSEASEAEIADTLGISRGTVKSTASRALDALENKLRSTR